MRLTEENDCAGLVALVAARSNDLKACLAQVDAAQQEAISYKRRHAELCRKFQEVQDEKAKGVESIGYERERVEKMEAELPPRSP